MILVVPPVLFLDERERQRSRNSQRSSHGQAGTTPSKTHVRQNSGERKRRNNVGDDADGGGDHELRQCRMAHDGGDDVRARSAQAAAAAARLKNGEVGELRGGVGNTRCAKRARCCRRSANDECASRRCARAERARRIMLSTTDDERTCFVFDRIVATTRPKNQTTARVRYSTIAAPRRF